MPKKERVLLAGESWVSAATHYKGFDQFGSVTFHLGAEPLVKALEGSDYDLRYMPAYEAATAFPMTMSELDVYGAVLLSDLGSNTLLLHPDVWLRGKPVPNRLKLLRNWVAGDGGLMMIGGYFSYQGINGAARWHKTPVEQVLPVTCLPIDDRVEVPDGFAAELVDPSTRCSRAWAASGRCCSASTRSSSRPKASSWPSCRTTKAATRCWSPATTARAELLPGPRTALGA